MAFIMNRSKKEPMSEINVTPFVDVMLVLLIIFMVTAPATPAKPITEPIDKSNPAELITNVAPIARIPITEVASKIFNMFEILRK